jgi:hypothetical protein
MATASQERSHRSAAILAKEKARELIAHEPRIRIKP